MSQLLDRMRAARQELFNVWSMRKAQLDQCFQLKLFEQDADKVSLLKVNCAKQKHADDGMDRTQLQALYRHIRHDRR